MHTFYFNGLSRNSKRAVFALRPDRDPEATSDHQSWCFDQTETIEEIEEVTFERLRQKDIYPELGLEIKIGDMVNDYTPPDIYIGKRLEHLYFGWSKMFLRLLGEEKKAMALFSRWLSHLKGDTILKEGSSNVEGFMGPVEKQAKLWTEDQLARPPSELARFLGHGMMPICRLIARRGRRQLKLKDFTDMVDYDNLLSEHVWFRRSMQGITEDSSAMIDYHKILSDHRWYRNPMQWTTKNPSNRPSSTSSAYWSGLTAASDSETDPRVALSSHGSCCLSSRHAVQAKSQYVQQSEALEPSHTDDDLAPDRRSLTNPVTPTKPSSRENLANVPKKSKKYARNFSESDIEEYTPSKRPRLVARPSIAAHPDNERESNMAMQVEDNSRSRLYNRYTPHGSIEAGMERMNITPSLASEDENMSQGSIVAGTEWIETTPFLIWEDEDVSQGSIEAGIESKQTTPSLDSENEDVSDGYMSDEDMSDEDMSDEDISAEDSSDEDPYDEDLSDEEGFSNSWVEATVVAEE